MRWSVLREHLLASWPFVLFAVLPVSLGIVTPHNWWYWPAQILVLALMQLGCWLQRRRRMARQALENRITADEFRKLHRLLEEHYPR